MIPPKVVLLDGVKFGVVFEKNVIKNDPKLDSVQKHYSCSPCRHSVNGAGLRTTFAGPHLHPLST